MSQYKAFCKAIFTVFCVVVVLAFAGIANAFTQQSTSQVKFSNISVSGGGGKIFIYDNNKYDPQTVSADIRNTPLQPCLDTRQLGSDGLKISWNLSAAKPAGFDHWYVRYACANTPAIAADTNTIGRAYSNTITWASPALSAGQYCKIWAYAMKGSNYNEGLNVGLGGVNTSPIQACSLKPSISILEGKTLSASSISITVRYNDTGDNSDRGQIYAYVYDSLCTKLIGYAGPSTVSKNGTITLVKGSLDANTTYCVKPYAISDDNVRGFGATQMKITTSVSSPKPAEDLSNNFKICRTSDTDKCSDFTTQSPLTLLACNSYVAGLGIAKFNTCYFASDANSVLACNAACSKASGEASEELSYCDTAFKCIGGKMTKTECKLKNGNKDCWSGLYCGGQWYNADSKCIPTTAALLINPYIPETTDFKCVSETLSSKVETALFAKLLSTGGAASANVFFDVYDKSAKLVASQGFQGKAGGSEMTYNPLLEQGTEYRFKASAYTAGNSTSVSVLFTTPYCTTPEPVEELSYCDGLVCRGVKTTKTKCRTELNKGLDCRAGLYCGGTASNPDQTCKSGAPADYSLLLSVPEVTVKDCSAADSKADISVIMMPSLGSNNSGNILVEQLDANGSVVNSKTIASVRSLENYYWNFSLSPKQAAKVRATLYVVGGKTIQTKDVVIKCAEEPVSVFSYCESKTCVARKMTESACRAANGGKDCYVNAYCGGTINNPDAKCLGIDQNKIEIVLPSQFDQICVGDTIIRAPVKIRIISTFGGVVGTATVKVLNSFGTEILSQKYTDAKAGSAYGNEVIFQPNQKYKVEASLGTSNAASSIVSAEFIAKSCATQTDEVKVRSFCSGIVCRTVKETAAECKAENNGNACFEVPYCGGTISDYGDSKCTSIDTSKERSYCSAGKCTTIKTTAADCRARNNGNECFDAPYCGGLWYNGDQKCAALDPVQERSYCLGATCKTVKTTAANCKAMNNGVDCFSVAYCGGTISDYGDSKCGAVNTPKFTNPTTNISLVTGSTINLAWEFLNSNYQFFINVYSLNDSYLGNACMRWMVNGKSDCNWVAGTINSTTLSPGMYKICINPAGTDLQNDCKIITLLSSQTDTVKERSYCSGASCVTIRSTATACREKNNWQDCFDAPYCGGLWYNGDQKCAALDPVQERSYCLGATCKTVKTTAANCKAMNNGVDCFSVAYCGGTISDYGDSKCAALKQLTITSPTASYWKLNDNIDFTWINGKPGETVYISRWLNYGSNSLALCAGRNDANGSGSCRWTVNAQLGKHTIWAKAASSQRDFDAKVEIEVTEHLPESSLSLKNNYFSSNVWDGPLQRKQVAGFKVTAQGSTQNLGRFNLDFSGKIWENFAILDVYDATMGTSIFSKSIIAYDFAQSGSYWRINIEPFRLQVPLEANYPHELQVFLTSRDGQLSTVNYQIFVNKNAARATGASGLNYYAPDKDAEVSNFFRIAPQPPKYFACSNALCQIVKNPLTGKEVQSEAECQIATNFAKTCYLNDSTCQNTCQSVCVKDGFAYKDRGDICCTTGGYKEIDSSVLKNDGSCTAGNPSVKICSKCGNGSCDSMENKCNCSQDCGALCTKVSQNAEDATLCCPGLTWLSNKYRLGRNGSCVDSGFTNGICVNTKCGDAKCEGNEDKCNCPTDCKEVVGCKAANQNADSPGLCCQNLDWLSNKYRLSSNASCVDSGFTNGICVTTKCGDTKCEGYEDKCNCPQDCSGSVIPGTCVAEGKVIYPDGSACCSGLTKITGQNVGYDGVTCVDVYSSGMGFCSKCGDGKCENPENKCNCPIDCACGNGRCDGNENYQTCPQDCEKPTEEKYCYKGMHIYFSNYPNPKVNNAKYWLSNWDFGGGLKGFGGSAETAKTAAEMYVASLCDGANAKSYNCTQCERTDLIPEVMEKICFNNKTYYYRSNKPNAESKTLFWVKIILGGELKTIGHDSESQMIAFLKGVMPSAQLKFAEPCTGTEEKADYNYCDKSSPAKCQQEDATTLTQCETKYGKGNCFKADPTCAGKCAKMVASCRKCVHGMCAYYDPAGNPNTVNNSKWYIANYRLSGTAVPIGEDTEMAIVARIDFLWNGVTKNDFNFAQCTETQDLEVDCYKNISIRYAEQGNPKVLGQKYYIKVTEKDGNVFWFGSSGSIKNDDQNANIAYLRSLIDIYTNITPDYVKECFTTPKPSGVKNSIPKAAGSLAPKGAPADDPYYRGEWQYCYPDGKNLSSDCRKMFYCDLRNACAGQNCNVTETSRYYYKLTSCQDGLAYQSALKGKTTGYCYNTRQEAESACKRYFYCASGNGTATNVLLTKAGKAYTDVYECTRNLRVDESGSGPIGQCYDSEQEAKDHCGRWYYCPADPAKKGCSPSNTYADEAACVASVIKNAPKALPKCYKDQETCNQACQSNVLWTAYNDPKEGLICDQVKERDRNGAIRQFYGKVDDAISECRQYLDTNNRKDTNLDCYKTFSECDEAISGKSRMRVCLKSGDAKCAALPSKYENTQAGCDKFLSDNKGLVGLNKCYDSLYSATCDNDCKNAGSSQFKGAFYIKPDAAAGKNGGCLALSGFENGKLACENEISRAWDTQVNKTCYLDVADCNSNFPKGGREAVPNVSKVRSSGLYRFYYFSKTNESCMLSEKYFSTLSECKDYYSKMSVEALPDCFGGLAECQAKGNRYAFFVREGLQGIYKMTTERYASPSACRQNVAKYYSSLKAYPVCYTSIAAASTDKEKERQKLNFYYLSNSTCRYAGKFLTQKACEYSTKQRCFINSRCNNKVI